MDSEQSAKSTRSLAKIAGAIIVIAFIISYLSQDPIIVASITTIVGLVIGFSSANIISNVIAGMYLAIASHLGLTTRSRCLARWGGVRHRHALHPAGAGKRQRTARVNFLDGDYNLGIKKEKKQSETAQEDAAIA